jgi:fucose permease
MTASALGMFSYAACSTATPICLVMVSRDLGLSLTQASGLEIARSLPLTMMLVAAVFAAGWLGKARSLYFGMLAMSAGLVAYAYAPTYATLLAALALAGLGGGLAEALINPLVQDASRGDSGRWLNLVNGFWSVGVLVTALGGGEWLERGGSWRLLMVGIAILGLASALLFHRVRRSAQPAPRRRAGEVWGQTTAFLKRRRFWRFAAMMTCAGGAEGAYTFWSASLVQLELGGSARAGGVATGAFAFGMILGRLAAGIWIKQHQLARLLLTCAVGGVGVGALLPALGHLAALVAGLFFAGLLVACFWPSLQAHAADRLPGDTTVLFVLLSLGGIPGFAVAVGLMGLVADHYSLRLAFGLVPVAFLGLAVLLWPESKRGNAPPHATGNAT